MRLSFLCTRWLIQVIAQSQLRDLGPFPRRRCWRKCREREKQWKRRNDSYHYWRINVISKSQGAIMEKRLYFLRELVTSVNTSWFSSSNSIIPKYPNRLSVNLFNCASSGCAISAVWVMKFTSAMLPVSSTRFDRSEQDNPTYEYTIILLRCDDARMYLGTVTHHERILLVEWTDNIVTGED